MRVMSSVLEICTVRCEYSTVSSAILLSSSQEIVHPSPDFEVSSFQGDEGASGHCENYFTTHFSISMWNQGISQ